MGGAAALCGGCTPAPPPPLELPNWLAPAASWRRQAPADEVVRLDLAAARHARDYRSLHGSGAHYRELLVPEDRALPEVLAAVDAALAAAGRAATRQPPVAGVEGETEVTWAAARGAPLRLVFLAGRPGPSGRGRDLVLLLEPK
jgi:hypothetical protein